MKKRNSRRNKPFKQPKARPIPRYSHFYWVCRGNACGGVFTDHQDKVIYCAPIFRKALMGQYFRFFREDERFKVKVIE